MQVRPAQGGRELPGQVQRLPDPPPRGHGALREGGLPVLRRGPEDRAAALRALRRPCRSPDQVHPDGLHPEGLHVFHPPEAQGPARFLGKGRHDQGQAAQAHQAAGSLFRRHSAHDREGHVHLQRHRAGRRQPAPALAGRVLPPGRGQGLLHRQDHPLPRRLGRVRARREEPPLGPARPEEEVPGHRLPPGPRLRRRRGYPQALPQDRQGRRRGRQALLGGRGRPGRPDRGRGRLGRQGPEGPGPGQEEDHPGGPGRAQGGRRHPGAGPQEGAPRGLLPRRHQGQGPDQRAPRGHPARPAHRPGRAVRGLLSRGGPGRRHHQHDPQERPAQGPARRPRRDLPQAAAGRAPHAGERPQPLPKPVLQSPEVQLLPHRPPQVQHQARPGDAARGEDALARGLRPGPQVPPEPALRRGLGRRHRPPRQPPGPVRRRARRERLPHRPDPHGADDQGEDDHHRRPGGRHAPGPHQLQARHRRAQGVLRQLAAVPVHGPDQRAGRDHP